MGKDASKPPSGFTRGMRKLYYPLGFKKGYNFYLCKQTLSSSAVAFLIQPRVHIRRHHVWFLALSVHVSQL